MTTRLIRPIVTRVAHKPTTILRQLLMNGIKHNGKAIMLNSHKTLDRPQLECYITILGAKLSKGCDRFCNEIYNSSSKGIISENIKCFLTILTLIFLISITLIIQLGVLLQVWLIIFRCFGSLF
eukprot:g38950.t1